MRALAVVLVAASAILGAHAQIRVMSPPRLVHDLKDHGRIPGSTATFGAPHIGDSILGRLAFGESKGQMHCTDDDYDLPKEGNPFTGESVLDSIVVVRRGKCSYTRKVRVAIGKRARAVLIVDNTALDRANVQNVIMSDDGNGGNISIPTVIITNEDGEMLIQHLSLRNWNGTRREEVVVEMSWGSSPSSGITTVDSWMSAGSRESLKFIKEFAPKRRLLHEVIRFTPRFNVFPIDEHDPDMVKQLCWDDGKYCTEVPDGAGVVTGREVLEEDIRMLCIHDVYRQAFWDYMERFGDRCPIVSSLPLKSPEKRFGSKCSTDLMTEVGIDTKKIRACVQQSAIDKLQVQLHNRAWGPRALRINGARYEGVLDANQVVTEICAGFMEQPQQCSRLISPGDALWSARLHQGVISDQRDPRSVHPEESAGFGRRHHHVMSWAKKQEALELWLFFMLLFFMSMVTVGAAFALYKCYIKGSRQARDVTVPQDEGVQDTEFARLD